MKAQIKTIQLINGPNLNLLGKREPHLYGSLTLKEINAELSLKAEKLGITLSFFQSNTEGIIIDLLHELLVHDPLDSPLGGIIINPGGLTHTSVALRDALLMFSCPMVEVHLSNIYKREPFRHKSLLADIVMGQLTGFGPFGYQMALEAIAHIIDGN
jgi:3-dehydroquinate dehydratase II